MSPNEYQDNALRTAPTEYPRHSYFGGVQHALMGIGSEHGELADAIKKHLIYGREIDWINIKEECGDLLWYIALMLNEAGYSMEECMIENIDKLRKRYPDKFTEFHAKERLDKKGE